MQKRLAILALLVTACSVLEPGAPNHARRPAIIVENDDAVAPGSPVIDAPDTMRVGVAALVTVKSYGGGCVAQGSTDASVSGLVAELRPYDIFTTGDVVCDLYLTIYSHTATITFAQPGVATIRAIGRSVSTGKPLTVTRTVIVVQ